MSKPTGRRVVTYECRDIGYGVERGEVVGYWDETRTNLGGAPAFDVTERLDHWDPHDCDPSSTLYLFDDEVKEDEPA